MITRLDRLQGRDIYENTALAKINELVDAVNLLQCKNVHIESDLQDLMYPKEIKGELGENATISKMEKVESRLENVQDEFAEQRKWIGSLVEYKLGDLFLYGILTDIKDGYTLPFVIDGTSYTKDCWLPDESVIYHKTKGGKMNSDMKCPICGTILDKAFINDKIRGCPKCRNMGNTELWQELIRTRKALEIIKKEFHKETMPDFAVIRDALKGVGDE